jgi:hypothetical protein
MNHHHVTGFLRATLIGKGVQGKECNQVVLHLIPTYRYGEIHEPETPRGT